MIRSLTRLEAPDRLRMLLALPAVAAAAAVLAACGSSGTSSTSGGGSTSTSSPAAATAGSLKTATIGGATALTDARGFAVYSFAPDTMTKSDCNGACAAAWPPVKGPLTASGSAAPAPTPSGSSSRHHDAPPSHAAVTTPAAPPATAPAQTANPIPQDNGGDHDADNNGGPSDGDGNI